MLRDRREENEKRAAQSTVSLLVRDERHHPAFPDDRRMPGGTIKRIYAIVEFEDGSIHECMPEHITFADGRVKEVFDAIKEADAE